MTSPWIMPEQGLVLSCQGSYMINKCFSNIFVLLVSLLVLLDCCLCGMFVCLVVCALLNVLVNNRPEGKVLETVGVFEAPKQHGKYETGQVRLSSQASFLILLSNI